MKKKVKPQRRSGFWKGLVIGGALAALAAYFGPSLLTHQTTNNPKKNNLSDPPKAKIVTDSVSLAKPKPLPNVSKPLGGIPLFRRPEVAASIAARVGLGESYPGSLLWKKTDELGWNSFASLTILPQGTTTLSGSGNSVSASLESNYSDHLEKVLLVANIANTRGESETLEKFRALALAFLNEAGCLVTRQLVDAIGLTTLETETPDASYSLRKIALSAASRWELTIKSR